MSTAVHSSLPMRSRFSDEDPSFRSTPDLLSTHSNPPSLRGRKPFLPVATLFGSLRAGIPTRSTKLSQASKAKPLDLPDSQFSINEKALDESAHQSTPATMPEISTRSVNPATTMVVPTPIQPPPSQPTKSRTILRRFTNKLRNASPPGTIPSIPEPPTSRTSREHREAALRQRGLLPPKDLSEQEQDQDRSLAVISSDTCSAEGSVDSGGSSATKSAASQIKEEWESRNNRINFAHLNRLNNFKFGGSTPEFPVLPTLETVDEVDSPPPSAPLARDPDVARFLSPSSPTDENTTPPKKATPPSPRALGFKIDTRLPPPNRSLPLSPSDPDFPTFIPLPPSPYTPRNPGSPHSEALVTNEKLADIPLPLSPPSSSPNDGAQTPRPKSPAAIESLVVVDPTTVPLPLSPLAASSPRNDGSQTPTQKATNPDKILAINPFTTPLPPSPLSPSPTPKDGTETPRPKASDSDDLIDFDALAIPLPPSPLSSGTPPAVPTRSFQNAVNEDASFKPLEPDTSLTNLPQITPRVYLTPPLSPSSPGPEGGQDGPSAVSSCDRSSSLPPLPSIAESETSAPSLCADTGSISTSESSPTTTTTTTTAITGVRKKAGGLRVGTTMPDSGVNSIPVIVESPIEGDDSVIQRPDHTTNLSFPAAADLVNADETTKETTLESESTDTALSAHASSSPNLNRDTSTSLNSGLVKGRKGRRKSINIFKRGNTMDSYTAVNGCPPSPSSPSPSDSNRLSVSTSLTNLRRSVVGSFSRPKSSSPVNRRRAVGGAGFDASHLPPSPTLPADFDPGQQQAGLGPGPGPRTRMGTFPGAVGGAGARQRAPLRPTIHSRGSILLEANEIEDEESRRLSEMAFLG